MTDEQSRALQGTLETYQRDKIATLERQLAEFNTENQRLRAMSKTLDEQVEEIAGLQASLAEYRIEAKVARLKVKACENRIDDDTTTLNRNIHQLGQLRSSLNEWREWAEEFAGQLSDMLPCRSGCDCFNHDLLARFATLKEKG